MSGVNAFCSPSNLEPETKYLDPPEREWWQIRVMMEPSGKSSQGNLGKTAKDAPMGGGPGGI